jgi:Ca-activated chloride channel homolog
MYAIQFAHSGLLYLILLIIPAIIWYVFRHNKVQAELQISVVAPAVRSKQSLRLYLRHVPFILRQLVFIMLIFVLARPQSTNHYQNATIEGIDIMLALDISQSMLAADLTPNRIDASKDVAAEFIAGRPNDRIGIVVFGGESFTQCPLTTDHAVLLNLLHEVNVGVIENQNTAIGLGLANAVKRLKDSRAKSRVVVLITDGVNNTGSVDPKTAAEIAKTFGIRVYTIGVGTVGTAPFPVQDIFGNTFFQPMEVEIDEGVLKQIASMTNGAYFRATNNQKLKDIYHEIDKLEKTKVDVKQYSKKFEEYRIFALAALLFLLLELFTRLVVLRSLT